MTNSSSTGFLGKNHHAGSIGLWRSAFGLARRRAGYGVDRHSRSDVHQHHTDDHPVPTSRRQHVDQHVTARQQQFLGMAVVVGRR